MRTFEELLVKLIRKIYEVAPLVCQECKRETWIIGFWGTKVLSHHGLARVCPYRDRINSQGTAREV